MTTWVSALLTFVALGGIAQAVVLAIALASRGGGPARTRWALVAVLMATAASLGAVVAEHRAAAQPHVLEGIEYATWLAVGPLVYLFFLMSGARPRVSGGCTDESGPRAPGARPSRWFVLHFVPAAAYGGLVLLASAGAAMTPLLVTASGVPVLALMAHQGSYTALSIRAHLRLQDPAGSPGRRWRSVAIVFLLLVHGAQVVRLTWSSVPALRDVVPAVAGAALLLLAAAGLRQSGLLALTASASHGASGLLPPGRSVEDGGPQPAPPRLDSDALDSAPRLGAAGVGARPKPSMLPPGPSRLAPERAREIAVRLRQALDEEAVHRDPELTVRTLASRLGAPRLHLSQVLRQQYGRGFLEEINHRRVGEAKRLLADPACASLTIEAIARRAGFRSRSTFYDVFRRLEGRAPTSLRRDE